MANTRVGPGGEKIVEACGDCQFLQGDTCHRYPAPMPGFPGAVYHDTYRVQWPRTEVSGWCGEYSASEKPSSDDLKRWMYDGTT